MTRTTHPGGQLFIRQKSDVSPPDKLPSLRFPRLANITVRRVGGNTTIDIYFWTSRYPSSRLLHLHVGMGDDVWLSNAPHVVERRVSLDPMPTFTEWLFSYLWFDPRREQSFADQDIGTWSLRASDYRIGQKLRDELSRLMRPVIAELAIEAHAADDFHPSETSPPVPIRLLPLDQQVKDGIQ